MNYSILCNEILKLNSKIRFAGVFNSRGESVAERDRDVLSLLSADETKMLVHYTFARWRHLQNLEHRLGKARTSVTIHEKVTLISLYLGSDLLLLSIEPDYNHIRIVKKIRTMLEDGAGTLPSKRKKRQTNNDKKVTKAKKKTAAKRSKPASKAKRRAILMANKRKRSTVAVKRKTTTTKAKKKTAAKRSKPASKAKRRAILVANKRKRDLEKANNRIKSLKKAIRLAEKSAKKKKTIYQQSVKRASQTR